MRAKLPSEEGFVERDGVKLIYGEGRETMVFIPPWCIVHSRIYKAQLPYFSERFRCITYDCRGNGKSDRPADPKAYARSEYIADALAVMDATNAGNTIVVALSQGALLASFLAANYPERIRAVVMAGATATIGNEHPYRTLEHFSTKRTQFEGWDKWNREYWLADYPDFAQHFIRNIFSEPHSTKQIEDGIEWASGTSGEILINTVDGRSNTTLDLSETMYR